MSSVTNTWAITQNDSLKLLSQNELNNVIYQSKCNPNLNLEIEGKKGVNLD